MGKDDNILEGGTVDEGDVILDFDLDDLTSDEGSGGGDDDNIIELVDLIEEDESGAMEIGETADDEIARLLEADPMEPGVPAGGGDVEISDEFEGMLDDVDLDETEADIDMSDVAVSLDFGTEDREDVAAAESDPGLEADLESMLNEEPALETALDPDATYPSRSAVELPDEPVEQQEAGSVEEPSETDEAGITDEDLQRMLEDEGEVDLDLESLSEDVPASEEPYREPEGEDITEEALEKMLEDEEGEEPQEPVPSEEETPPVYESVPEEGMEEPSPPQAGAGISEERMEGIIRGVVEEVVSRELGRTMADVAERVIRESVTDAAERVIRETIEALKADLKAVQDR